MRLNLTWDRTETELIEAFERLRTRQYVIQSLLPNGFQRLFRQRARYTNAHTSTAIEGNPLSETEAMQVLLEGSDAETPDAIEKVNVELAYTFMEQLAQDQTLAVDQGLIRSIHSLLLRGLPGPAPANRGKYRVGQAAVVDSQTRELQYLPPPPEQVPQLMEGFVEDLQAFRHDTPGPAAAGLAHFGLISIHPFDDGNGRTARMLADLVMYQSDSHFDQMLSVSKAIFDDRDAYYTALRAAQGRDFKEEVDATPFLKYHSRALCRAADDLEREVVEFKRVKDDLVRNARGVLNERQVTGIMFMLGIGPISSSAYAALTDSSQSTAVADLNALVENGVCERRGKGKLTRYISSPRLATSPAKQS